MVHVNSGTHVPEVGEGVGETVYSTWEGEQTDVLCLSPSGKLGTPASGSGLEMNKCVEVGRVRVMGKDVTLWTRCVW